MQALVQAANWKTRAPGWAVSAVIHMILLVSLALMTIKPNHDAQIATLDNDYEELPPPAEMKVDIEPDPIAPQPENLETPAPQINDQKITPTTAAAGDMGGTPSNVDALTPVAMADLSAIDASATSLPVGKARTEGFGARGTGKGIAISQGGGTLQTEFSVNAGLEWLVNHQFPDGRWKCDHREHPKAGTTTGYGDAKADTAATALALLPFLAGDNTHRKGPHRERVKKALDWLTRNQQSSGLVLAKSDNQFYEMYTHGLATIVLCEAYGLTKDPELLKHAQRAVEYTVRVQAANPLGGWHYTAMLKTADTSVFGWNLMSLKSAQMAGIHVDPKAIEKAKKYLDDHAIGKNKSQYVYMKGEKVTRPSMTAVGLLCRQYLGGGRDDPAFVEGIQCLLKSAPPDKEKKPYYWYYSTQVVHHYQGPEWIQWNRGMRKIWVERQVRDKKSTDFGSWDPKEFLVEHDIKAGGRHYLTCIGLLTLEVYYRYLPLYEVISGESKAVAKSAAKEEKPEM